VRRSDMLTVKINNMPTKPRKLVVSRLIDGELWYYANFDEEDRDRAEKCRDEVDGLIVEVM
jgi:hypothetical protein